MVRSLIFRRDEIHDLGLALHPKDRLHGIGFRRFRELQREVAVIRPADEFGLVGIEKPTDLGSRRLRREAHDDAGGQAARMRRKAGTLTDLILHGNRRPDRALQEN